MLKKLLIIFSVLYLIGIFQSSFLIFFFPDGLTPNLLLITIIFLVALKGLNNAFVAVLFSGIIMDILSLSRIGSNIISFAVIALGVSFLTKRLSVSQPIWRFFILISLIGGASYLDDLITHGLNLLSGEALNSGLTFFSVEAFKYLLGNILIASIIYRPLKKLITLGILSYEDRRMIIR